MGAGLPLNLGSCRRLVCRVAGARTGSQATGPRPSPEAPDQRSSFYALATIRRVANLRRLPASSNVALSATFPMALSNTCWPNRWLFQSSRLTRVPLIGDTCRNHASRSRLLPLADAAALTVDLSRFPASRRVGRFFLCATLFRGYASALRGWGLVPARGSSASAERPFFDGGWSLVKGTGHTHSLNYFAAPRTAGSAATIETRRAGTQGGSAAPRGAGERDPTSGRGPPKPSERSSAQCQLACALH